MPLQENHTLTTIDYELDCEFKILNSGVAKNLQKNEKNAKNVSHAFNTFCEITETIKLNY